MSLGQNDAYSYLSVPDDKGITSFTVTTSKEGATKENPVILFVDLGFRGSVYANGVPFIVEGAISLGGDIYGDADGRDTGSTSILYDGATAAYNRTAIYGGGHNGNVEGSTSITIRDTNQDLSPNSGTYFTVTGGGGSTVSGATANVSGNTEIHIYGTVLNVWGGGSASSGNVTANVGGDTMIHFHEGALLARKVYGGGDAGNTATDELSGTAAVANVAGTAHIIIDSALKQVRYDGDYIVGGGYASLSKPWVVGGAPFPLSNCSAIADVGGVLIQINADVSNNTEGTTNRAVLGGGDNDKLPSAPAWVK